MSLMLLALAATLPYTCTALQGAQSVVSNPSLRWLMVGEPGHGTNEMPRVAADLVCAAIAKRRPVVVAIEYRAMNQPFIDAYLRSNGDSAARDALLQAPAWDRSWADGKSSQAMFRFIEWLRVQHTRDHVKRVVAFEADMVSGMRTREVQMAHRLRAIDPGARGLVIVLTGSFHARKRGKLPVLDPTPPPHLS